VFNIPPNNDYTEKTPILEAYHQWCMAQKPPFHFMWVAYNWYENRYIVSLRGGFVQIDRSTFDSCATHQDRYTLVESEIAKHRHNG
jgi:hypothetical protein